MGTSIGLAATDVTAKPKRKTPAVVAGALAIDPQVATASPSKSSVLSFSSRQHMEEVLGTVSVAMEPDAAAGTTKRARSAVTAATSPGGILVESEATKTTQKLEAATKLKPTEADVKNGDTSTGQATEANRGMIQTPTVEQNLTTFSGEGLPTAVLVTEENSKSALAEICEDGSPPPFYKRTAFRTVIVVLAIVVLAVTLSLTLFSNDNDEKIPNAAATSPPTVIPTTSSTAREDILIREDIIDLAGHLVCYSPEAFASALDWFVEDELRHNVTNTTNTRHRGYKH